MPTSAYGDRLDRPAGFRQSGKSSHFHKKPDGVTSMVPYGNRGNRTLKLNGPAFSTSLMLALCPAVFSAEVKFTKVTLTSKYFTEAVAYGDFNHDGQLDVTSGS